MRWYTTQGWLRNVRNVESYGRPLLRTDAWVPGLAFQQAAGRRLTHVVATGVVGEVQRRCDVASNRSCERERRWSLAPVASRTGLRTICPPVTLIAWSMTT